MTRKATINVIALLIWEVGIYFLSFKESDLVENTFQLAARYSARTSFIIFACMLTWVGWQGLRDIYKAESSRQTFVLFMLGFAWNHLLHFIYLCLNYQVSNLQLFAGKNLFG